MRVRASAGEPAGGDLRVRASAGEPAGGDVIARLREERGFTLVELLVTMGVLSIVMALITGSAIFLQRSVRQTEQRFDDLAQARLAMDATSKWLRGAVTIERGDTSESDRDPFTQAMRRRVDFITSVTTGNTADDAPQRVRLEVTNQEELEERVWPGRVNANGIWTQAGGPRSRIIARGLVDGEPFSFFDAEGNEITPAGEGNLTQAEREAIRYVGINIVVQQEPAVDTPAAQLNSRVALPNQFYFDAEDDS
jgi:prepilin-type N-terminal cleavage/methylation domain-containing protein